jgi:hypothetical protein
MHIINDVDKAAYKSLVTDQAQMEQVKHESIIRVEDFWHDSEHERMIYITQIVTAGTLQQCVGARCCVDCPPPCISVPPRVLQTTLFCVPCSLTH